MVQAGAWSLGADKLLPKAWSCRVAQSGRLQLGHGCLAVALAHGDVL